MARHPTAFNNRYPSATSPQNNHSNKHNIQELRLSTPAQQHPLGGDSEIPSTRNQFPIHPDASVAQLRDQADAHHLQNHDIQNPEYLDFRPKGFWRCCYSNGLVLKAAEDTAQAVMEAEFKEGLANLAHLNRTRFGATYTSPA
eukprot:5393104-Alexandrium_andersonii.AAC.1